MVKCVVSGCPNRVRNVNRVVFNQRPKRFFNFPKDPTRVKVWLAALRETDRQDSAEQHVICEDHFLPEDISSSGVSSDAIPLMPPCLDGPMGLISPWGAESEEEEEEPWADGGGDEEEEEEDGGGEGGLQGPAKAEPPRRVPAARKPSGGAETSGVRQRGGREAGSPRRRDVSVGLLTQRFLELMRADPDRSLDIRQAKTDLQSSARRINDVVNVLLGVCLIEKKSKHRFQWIGRCQISSLLSNHREKAELENMKLVEETLDGLIKSCAQQLFDMTDDAENAKSAYVTHDDVRRLQAFQEQTVIVVKAPEETKLEVPAPKEDSIQVHLKAGRSPIVVLACDVGENGGCFLSLEESRIETAALRAESCGPQGAVQSA